MYRQLQYNCRVCVASTQRSAAQCVCYRLLSGLPAAFAYFLWQRSSSLRCPSACQRLCAGCTCVDDHVPADLQIHVHSEHKSSCWAVLLRLLNCCTVCEGRAGSLDVSLLGVGWGSRGRHYSCCCDQSVQPMLTHRANTALQLQEHLMCLIPATALISC